MIERSRGSRSRDRAKGRRRNWVVSIAGLWLLAVVVVSVLAGAIFGSTPADLAIQNAFRPPAWMGGSWAHPLGTDSLGRDVLTMIAYGGRIALLVGILGAAIGAVIGTVIGLASGYRGGMVDAVASTVIDAQLALPIIILALAALVAFDPSLPLTVVIIVTGVWVPVARVIRSQVLTLREREFVQLARVSGVPGRVIVRRHILPNVIPSVLVLSTLDVGRVIILEASLSFLGLGIQPPDTSWGLLVAGGRDYLTTAPWIILAPGIVLALTALSVNVLGDALRDHLDPRLKRVA